jgi:hypothetical protein
MKTGRISEYNRDPPPPWEGLAWIIGTWVVLVLATTGLLWFDADQEPYFGPIVAWQLVVVPGGGSILFGGWLTWGLAVVWAVRAGRMTKYWLAHLLWAAAGLVVAYSVVTGYFLTVGKP